MNPKYNIPDTEKYFIIGRKIEDRAEELGIDKIGEEETLIEIPKEIIDEKQSSSKTKSENTKKNQ